MSRRARRPELLTSPLRRSHDALTPGDDRQVEQIDVRKENDPMRTRRSIALLATAGALALGGTATATAGPAKGPGSGSDATKAQRCAKVGHAIDALELTATRL